MPGRTPGKEGRAAHFWNLKDIQELIDLLVAREISEFEMEKDGFRVRIKRGSVHEPAPGGLVLPPVFPGAPTPPPSRAVTAVPSEASEGSAAELSEDVHIIRSPIVGTFYNAPSPNAAPFVKPGDVVQAGQVLCIIEAMKLMNEIESEVAGEIVRIYVENGQPVEYGQSLFAVKPSRKK